MNKFTIPMKVKRTPLKKCEECDKRKLSTILYEVHDRGLNSHVNYRVCRKCMKEAKKRARKKKNAKMD